MSRSWEEQLDALGAFIRQRRTLANLSLRQLAERTRVSNPYLSQIERGKHEPSVRVLKAIADALGLRVETLFAQVGLLDEEASSTGVTVESAIMAESRLSDGQKQALISVYRSMLPPEADAAAADAAAADAG